MINRSINRGRPTSFNEFGRKAIKSLIWIYLVLLIVEGAIRKWVLPELSAPLLIVRDPIVLFIYFIALFLGLFHRQKMLLVVFFLAFSFTVVSAYEHLVNPNRYIFVTLYGLRTYFLHLPLIFIVPLVFTRADFDRMGFWLCVVAIPMALLVMLQFQSAPDHILNRTSTGEGKQIESAMGKIRPAGTFSFITGVAQYYALVTAFILYGVAEAGKLPKALMLSAGVSLMCALAVSGSRTAVMSCGIVFGMLLVGCVVRPEMARHLYKLLILGGVAALFAASSDVFNEGVKIMTVRNELARGVEGSDGFYLRILDGFLEPFLVMERTPFFGHGAGVGTNVGAQLIAGELKFLLAEGEWLRTILEVGPLLGTAYLSFRVILFLWLGWLSCCSARRGDLLPLLLFGACGPIILTGGFGQATTLGFTCLGAGLCLAAANLPDIHHENFARRKLRVRSPGKHAAIRSHAQDWA